MKSGVRSGALAVLTAGVLLAGAMPAWAQAFEKAAEVAITPCVKAEPSKDPAGAIAVCQTALAGLAEIRTRTPPASAHETNVDLIMRVMAEIRIGRGYLGQDGVRSARTCTMMESAWTLLSKTDPPASPAYAGMITSLVDNHAATVRQCRSEFGTPADAPPLP